MIGNGASLRARGCVEDPNVWQLAVCTEPMHSVSADVQDGRNVSDGQQRVLHGDGALPNRFVQL